MVETHSEKRLIGYARASTFGETFGSQLAQFRAAGCSRMQQSEYLPREGDRCAGRLARELNWMLGKLGVGDV